MSTETFAAPKPEEVEAIQKELSRPEEYGKLIAELERDYLSTPTVPEPHAIDAAVQKGIEAGLFVAAMPPDPDGSENGPTDQTFEGSMLVGVTPEAGALLENLRNRKEEAVAAVRVRTDYSDELDGLSPTEILTWADQAIRAGEARGLFKRATGDDERADGLFRGGNVMGTTPTANAVLGELRKTIVDKVGEEYKKQLEAQLEMAPEDQKGHRLSMLLEDGIRQGKLDVQTRQTKPAGKGARAVTEYVLAPNRDVRSRELSLGYLSVMNAEIADLSDEERQKFEDSLSTVYGMAPELRKSADQYLSKDAAREARMAEARAKLDTVDVVPYEPADDDDSLKAKIWRQNKAEASYNSTVDDKGNTIYALDANGHMQVGGRNIEFAARNKEILLESELAALNNWMSMPEMGVELRRTGEIPWEQFEEQLPDGQVLTQEQRDALEPLVWFMLDRMNQFDAAQSKFEAVLAAHGGDYADPDVKEAWRTCEYEFRRIDRMGPSPGILEKRIDELYVLATTGEKPDDSKINYADKYEAAAAAAWESSKSINYADSEAVEAKEAEDKATEVAEAEAREKDPYNRLTPAEKRAFDAAAARMNELAAGAKSDRLKQYHAERAAAAGWDAVRAMGHGTERRPLEARDGAEVAESLEALTQRERGAVSLELLSKDAPLAAAEYRAVREAFKPNREVAGFREYGSRLRGNKAVQKIYTSDAYPDMLMVETTRIDGVVMRVDVVKDRSVLMGTRGVKGPWKGGLAPNERVQDLLENEWHALDRPERQGVLARFNTLSTGRVLRAGLPGEGAGGLPPVAPGPERSDPRVPLPEPERRGLGGLFRLRRATAGAGGLPPVAAGPEAGGLPPAAVGPEAGGLPPVAPGPEAGGLPPAAARPDGRPPLPDASMDSDDGRLPGAVADGGALPPVAAGPDAGDAGGRRGLRRLVPRALRRGEAGSEAGELPPEAAGPEAGGLPPVAAGPEAGAGGPERGRHRRPRGTRSEDGGSPPVAPGPEAGGLPPVPARAEAASLPPVAVGPETTVLPPLATGSEPGGLPPVAIQLGSEGGERRGLRARLQERRATRQATEAARASEVGSLPPVAAGPEAGAGGPERGRHRRPRGARSEDGGSPPVAPGPEAGGLPPVPARAEAASLPPVAAGPEVAPSASVSVPPSVVGPGLRRGAETLQMAMGDDGEPAVSVPERREGIARGLRRETRAAVDGVVARSQRAVAAARRGQEQVTTAARRRQEQLVETAQERFDRRRLAQQLGVEVPPVVPDAVAQQAAEADLQRRREALRARAEADLAQPGEAAARPRRRRRATEAQPEPEAAAEPAESETERQQRLQQIAADGAREALRQMNASAAQPAAGATASSPENAGEESRGEVTSEPEAAAQPPATPQGVTGPRGVQARLDARVSAARAVDELPGVDTSRPLPWWGLYDVAFRATTAEQRRRREANEPVASQEELYEVARNALASARQSTS